MVVTVAYSLFRRTMPPLWATDSIFSIAVVGGEFERSSVLCGQYSLCCDGCCVCERSIQMAVLSSSLWQTLHLSQPSLFHNGSLVQSAMEHPLGPAPVPSVGLVSASLWMKNS